VGKHSGSSGSSCVACARGRFITSASVCQLCPAGRFLSHAAPAQYSCDACGGKYAQYSGAYRSGCVTNCAPGEYRASSTSCSSCPDGKYTSVYGAAACTTCTSGQFSNANYGRRSCHTCSAPSVVFFGCNKYSSYCGQVCEDPTRRLFEASSSSSAPTPAPTPALTCPC